MSQVDGTRPERQQSDARRRIPRTDRLLSNPDIASAAARLGEQSVRDVVREVQDSARRGELDPDEVESVGPGWEYYLDRLVAAETGGDPDAVDFARDYHPAMSGHYRPLAEQLRARD